MTNIFDVVLYVFQWCSETSFFPISIGGVEFQFTILTFLLIPVFASLTIFVVRHIIDLANN